MQPATAKPAPFRVEASVDELLSTLMSKLGGPYAVLEHLSSKLEGALPGSSITDASAGYCYLRLFDEGVQRDAIHLGPCPTVAELRRFSNGRADPFGNRGVTVKVHQAAGERMGHVVFDGGIQGLKPASALAALAKELRVGLPDGVSPYFPPDWIPHDEQVAQCWDFVSGRTRNLDLFSWIGSSPSWLDGTYETISASTSRVRWTVRAAPLGPSTATVDVIDPAGKVITVRDWTSHVAHNGYHQGWQVRGNKVFVEAHIWRAAKLVSDPTGPAPTPTRPGRHEDLFRASSGVKASVVIVPADLNTPLSGISGNPSVPVPPDIGNGEAGFGWCYVNAFKDPVAAAKLLGRFPTVQQVLDYAGTAVRGEFPKKAVAWLVEGLNRPGIPTVHHVVEGPCGEENSFWTSIVWLPPDDRLGATQPGIVSGAAFENVSNPTVLSVKPRASGLVIDVPFVAILKFGQETLVWDITSGKKLSAIMSYFESVEMVALKIRVTVHQGDNSTLVSVVADTMETALRSDADWVGAAHTLHVSGNTNGATTGELVLAGNHGFGTQLKGLAVGNPTPVVQAKLETSVTATAFLKAVLTVRVSGTGIPVAMVLPTKASKAQVLRQPSKTLSPVTSGGAKDAEEESD